MQTFIAGLLVGYAMGLIATFTTVWLIYFLMRRGQTGWMESGGWSASLGAVIVGAGTFAWLCMGLVAVVLWAVLGGADARDGLGSPNLPFTLVMVSFAWLALPPLFLLLPRYWWYYGTLALTYMVLFGWAFPLIANRA